MRLCLVLAHWNHFHSLRKELQNTLCLKCTVLCVAGGGGGGRGGGGEAFKGMRFKAALAPVSVLGR